MDETMSEAIAFTEENKEDSGKDGVFKFDEVKEETPADSQSESEQVEETSSSSEEEEQDVVEEQRVPYSRFKSKVEELEQRDNIIADLEERLSTLETQRAETNPEDIDVPKEWVELYGDSDIAKNAYRTQVRMNEQIQENAVRKALEEFRNEAVQQESQLEENEAIIDDNLASLQEAVGRKFSPKIEEEILSIVDEFSPTGEDGKYLSLFPFDKAYEIYELRNQRVTQKTTRARNEVAELTGNSSEGEVESSDSSFKRGWDNWREAL